MSARVLSLMIIVWIVADAGFVVPAEDPGCNARRGAAKEGSRFDNWPARNLTYRELTERADLVAIATLQTIEKGRRDLYRGDLQNDSIDVCVATLDVAAVLKGTCKRASIAVVHPVHKDDGLADFSLSGSYGFAASKTRPVFTIIDAPGQPPTFGGLLRTQAIKPEYLVFLKQRDDGRYELVSWGVKGRWSVRYLNLD